MIDLGNVPANSTLYIPFSTYGVNGESITISGFAVTDIEIYKNGVPTTRASDAGYSLLDTDGVDFAGQVGVHGFSIDLSDNTDSGFFAVGSFYWVILATVTVSSQAVNHVAATFRIVAAEAVAGLPAVNVTHAAGTAWNSGAITAPTFASGAIDAASIASNAITSAKIASGAITTATFAAGAINAAAIGADAITSAKIADNAFDANTFATNCITSNAIAGGAIDADAVAADVIDEIFDEVVAGSTTLRMMLRGFAAALLGKASGLNTSTAIYRNIADTMPVITATVDSFGNRTAVTLDLDDTP